MTDAEGSNSCLDCVSIELEELHRDLHTIRDAVDEVRTTLGIEAGVPTMCQRTSIEEMPERPGEEIEPPSANTPGRARPGL